MTTLTIYGVAFSNYVRTVRMALAEKGIAYELKPCAPGFEDGTARHPFGKIPFMRYGDLVLAESIAIIRFVERSFPGSALWPAETKQAALCDQWVSAISDVVHRISGVGITFPRLAAPVLGLPVDEAEIAAAAAKLPACLAELERQLTVTPYLAGDAVTVADLYLFPMFYYLGLTPEGAAALPGFPKLLAWRDRMEERASAKATVPPSFDTLRSAA
jgi:glutathione S-transferase